MTIEADILIVQESPESYFIVAAERGLPGASGAGVNYTQSSAASVWTINHNLGFRPDVELADMGGQVMQADILHVSGNQCTVSFALPMAGTARLS